MINPPFGRGQHRNINNFTEMDEWTNPDIQKYRPSPRVIGHLFKGIQLQYWNWWCSWLLQIGVQKSFLSTVVMLYFCWAYISLEELRAAAAAATFVCLWIKTQNLRIEKFYLIIYLVGERNQLSSKLGWSWSFFHKVYLVMDHVFKMCFLFLLFGGGSFFLLCFVFKICVLEERGLPFV